MSLITISRSFHEYCRPLICLHYARSAYLITKFCLKLLSLPEKEIRAIVPQGPIRDHLLDELEVLRFRRGRITGSFRFERDNVWVLKFA